MKGAHEKPLRSVIKAFSWRIIATLMTVLLVLIFTDKIDLALKVGFLEFSLKIIFFYFHERFWNVLDWGRMG